MAMRGSHNKAPRGSVRGHQRRDKAGHLEELAHDRRHKVYKTDPSLFTGEEDVRTKRVPKRGTPERVALDARIVELLQSGMTQLDVATETETYATYVWRVWKEYRRVTPSE